MIFIIVLFKEQHHHIITFSRVKEEIQGDWIWNTHENSGTTWTGDLKIQELSLFFNWLLHGWGKAQPLIPAVWHLRELLCLLAMFLQHWQKNWATLKEETKFCSPPSPIYTQISSRCIDNECGLGSKSMMLFSINIPHC